ncbi:programmed cell death 2-like [Olea europaea subsp. europaea]|uniref:Programmed cell death 2-like n=1 Tax=Olea europaea subsp. europaea TaxID=158383 RepID=A0A8S0QGG0_OLEEU|nr:programmed cell death 2-like [Olea europaea subsp. europaea]
MGEVILGMPGPWADNNYEAADHYTTKIGGLPDWPFPVNIERPNLLECYACGSNLCLIVQVYAPISSKSLEIEERVIYVFGCVKPECRSTPVSWRVLRVQQPSGSVELASLSDKMVPLSPPSVSNNDWQEDLWSFESGGEDGDGDIDLEELGRALSEAAGATSVSKKPNYDAASSGKRLPTNLPASSIDDKIPVVPCFYIHTQKEKFSKDIIPEFSKLTLLCTKEYEENRDDESDREPWEQESYEYDKALNADRTYLKFKKRIDAHPEQCFRYSYGGKPLLASGEVGDPGTCRLCGGSRNYEMQLMPPVIYFLQEAADDQQRIFIEKFDWMTLIIYTCSKSCSQSNQEKSLKGWVVAEEAVVIQYE